MTNSERDLARMLLDISEAATKPAPQAPPLKSTPAALLLTTPHPSVTHAQRCSGRVTPTALQASSLGSLAKHAGQSNTSRCLLAVGE